MDPFRNRRIVIRAIILSTLSVTAIVVSQQPVGEPLHQIRETLADGSITGFAQLPAGTSATSPALAVPPPEPPVQAIEPFHDDHAPLPGPVQRMLEESLTEVDLGPSQVAETPVPKPLAAGDVLIKRDTTLAGPSGYTSSVAEPSVGSQQSALFQSYNWYAARSTNNGSSWSYISPYTTFPTTGSFAGGFCCDQRVTQDASRNLIIWSLQYIKTNSTSTGTNGIRIAVAHGAADIASNTWQYRDVVPGNFSSTYSSGYWLDYPSLEVSSSYLYFTYNLFTTTTDTWAATVIGRMPLAALDSNSPLTMDTFVTTQYFSMAPVSGASDRMFFAAVRTSNSIVVIEWPEASTTPTTHIVSGLNTTYFSSFVCTAFDGTNPCGRSDTRVQTGWVANGELGFSWPSSQNAGAGRPYPFTRVAILNASSPTTVLSQPDLWSSSVAYLYPALAVNGRGHLGGVIDVLGGSQGTNIASTLTGLLRDDYSGSSWTPVSIATSDAGTNSRWGDYNASVPHELYPRTWLLAGRVQTGSTANSGSRVHSTWLMRTRDDPDALLFTDDPITAKVTLVRAVHITELRTRIDAIRSARGLGGYSWASTVVAGATIRATAIIELRAALHEAYVAAKRTPPVYTDPSLAAGGTIRAVHISELRAAVVAIE